jgi:hypothetical protein
VGRYFRWRVEDKAPAKSRWAEPKLSVALANGRRIEVSGGVEVGLLEQLIRILERAAVVHRARLNFMSVIAAVSQMAQLRNHATNSFNAALPFVRLISDCWRS